MLVVDGKVEYITNFLYHTNDELKDLENKWHILKKYEVCCLDPGGMYCTKIEHTEFEIDGYKFDVQLSRIEEVLECMDAGDDRIPGYIRFPNFRWLTVLPKELFDKVKAQLKKIEMTDEALHSELTEKDIRENVFKKWNKTGM
tara:strand:+ start:99 stop:527 length:429 start_codon:yes stop_codon:yes gene_type:complete